MNRDNEQARLSWALVQLPAGQAKKADQFMQCLERLLRFNEVERMLLLPGSAALLLHLKQLYAGWGSREGKTRLCERYPVQEPSAAEDASGASVWIASLRQAQLRTSGANALPRRAFDAILVYDIAGTSPVWKAVLTYFEAPYRIGFSQGRNPQLVQLFGGRLLSSQAFTAVRPGSWLFDMPTRASEELDGKKGGGSHIL
jgi:hypothetical protein